MAGTVFAGRSMTTMMELLSRQNYTHLRIKVLNLSLLENIEEPIGLTAPATGFVMPHRSTFQMASERAPSMFS